MVVDSVMDGFSHGVMNINRKRKNIVYK